MLYRPSTCNNVSYWLVNASTASKRLESGGVKAGESLLCSILQFQCFIEFLLTFSSAYLPFWQSQPYCPQLQLQRRRCVLLWQYICPVEMQGGQGAERKVSRSSCSELQFELFIESFTHLLFHLIFGSHHPAVDRWTTTAAAWNCCDDLLPAGRHCRRRRRRCYSSRASRKRHGLVEARLHRLLLHRLLLWPHPSRSLARPLGTIRIRS